jgi:uncharacterized protein
LLATPTLDPEAEAAKYLKPEFATEQGDKNPGVPDTKAALEGARQILMEQFAEDAILLGNLRDHMQQHGVLISKIAEGKETAAAKFRDYFDYSESIKNIPSHRALALFRGRTEEFLRLSLKLPEELAAETPTTLVHPCEGKIAARFGINNKGRAADAWLQQTVRWTWQVKVSWQIESELFTALRETAETEAIRVFARNLHDLLWLHLRVST